MIVRRSVFFLISNRIALPSTYCVASSICLITSSGRALSRAALVRYWICDRSDHPWLPQNVLKPGPDRHRSAAVIPRRTGTTESAASPWHGSERTSRYADSSSGFTAASSALSGSGFFGLSASMFLSKAVRPPSAPRPMVSTAVEGTMIMEPFCLSPS